MPQRSLIIGTAGHIDHGKTVLVKALTGKDTDRLAEEKRRGISIELGFAALRLPDGQVAGVVDVPGHENFVRTMVAGATGVDLALLVVAADDGVMPQTREHLAILDILGVSNGVVAITKTDLVDEELLPLVEDEVSELLEGTSLEGSPVIRVSAVTGSGLDELNSALGHAAAAVRFKDEALPPRLPIDRVFTLKGIGTVVTGTLWSGTLESGQQLALLPSQRRVRVRGLQVHDEDRRVSRAGERVAVNLAGVSTSEVARGDVLATPGYLTSTYMLDSRLAIMQEWTRPVKRGARVRFLHGTRETLGRVYPLSGDSIEPGEARAVQLRLEAEPTCAPGDRFVLRSYSPVTTIGGGTIVDAHPSKHKVDDANALREFELLEAGDPVGMVAIHLGRVGGPVTPQELTSRSGLPPAVVSEGLAALVADGSAMTLGSGTFFISASARDAAAKSVRSSLDVFHREKPLAGGIARETLKKKVLGHWDTRAADAFLDELAAEGAIEPDGTALRLPGASPAVSSRQRDLLEGIIGRIERKGVSPPAVGELAGEFDLDRGTLVELLCIAQKEGRATRISPDLYFSPAVVSEIETKLREAIGEGRGITVSDFKNLIGTTRKYALPLLEFYDRNRVTTRVGDLRKLR